MGHEIQSPTVNSGLFCDFCPYYIDFTGETNISQIGGLHPKGRGGERSKGYLPFLLLCCLQSGAAGEWRLLEGCPSVEVALPLAVQKQGWQYHTMLSLLLPCCWQGLCLRRWAPGQQLPLSSCSALTAVLP